MTTAVSTEKKTISVIIIEDFKLTRVGLRCALNSNEDINVVAESDNAIDGLRLIESKSPNIVLMDLGLAGMNGIEATIKVKEMNKDIKVIALTSHDREEEVIAALSSGAMAYCLKDIDPTKLADVIRDVNNGVCWLDPVIARKVLDSFPKQETLGILKDNTGDNISGKNKYFSELTVLYWLWKNSSADYKGLVHYRRFFDLGNGSIRWIDKIPQNYTQMFCLSKSYLEHILSDYDIILPMKRVIPKYKSIYDQYKNRHVISDLDRVMEIIKEKYPQMYDTAVYVMKNTKEIYLYNMFIANKSIFDDYAKWLFDILFVLEKEIQPEVEVRSEYQKRVYGFLSERLFTVYLQYLKMQGIKMIELPVIYCETNKNRFNIVKFRTKIYKLLTAAGIRRPHWKEQYGV